MPNFGNNPMKLFLKIKSSSFKVPIALIHYASFSHEHFTECDVGLYGANCEGFCSADCRKPGVCDKVTGQCEGGCQAGWKNAKCDQGKH